MRPYYLIREIMFKFDAEKVHNFILGIGSLLGKTWLTKRILRKFFVYKNKMLNIEVLGIKFENPIGLAAGFDKNAVLTDVLPNVGFGFTEVGSITAEKCEGNKKPRLFRLTEDKALLVRLGLPSEGAVKIANKLKDKKFNFPVGINIAKTNDVNIIGEKAINDYVRSIRLFKDIGDYITINLSCPNIPDKDAFSNPILLAKLLKEVKKVVDKPILLKIALDLNSKNYDGIIRVAKKYAFVKGFVISNLSTKRDKLRTDKNILNEIGNGGGISGKPAKDKSNELIKYFYKKTKGKYIIIGCGGVFNAEDAYEKIKLGASLVQLITGMIYEGPGLIKEINKGLVELMKRDSYKNIKEAVGVG